MKIVYNNRDIIPKRIYLDNKLIYGSEPKNLELQLNIQKYYFNKKGQNVTCKLSWNEEYTNYLKTFGDGRTEIDFTIIADEGNSNALQIQGELLNDYSGINYTITSLEEFNNQINIRFYTTSNKFQGNIEFYAKFNSEKYWSDFKVEGPVQKKEEDGTIIYYYYFYFDTSNEVIPYIYDYSIQSVHSHTLEKNNDGTIIEINEKEKNCSYLQIKNNSSNPIPLIINITFTKVKEERVGEHSYTLTTTSI